MKPRPIILCLALACLVSRPAVAASLSAELFDEQGRPLPDVVLSLVAQGASSQPGTGLMDQRGKQFSPRVLAVRTGTEVSFPNSDDIRHHVYSFSPAKRFELRLYKDTPSAPVLFDQPGVVVLGCNIHDWMVGYIYVTDHPWFAVSDAQGRLTIDGLPAGSYQVNLWHPRLENMQALAAGTLQVPEQGLSRSFALPLAGPLETAAPPNPSAFGEAFRKATREVQP